MKRILLAEDEEVLQMLIADCLEDEGYHVDVASDGIMAYELFQENEYNLCLVDYMMPGMTGIELIKKNRIHESKGTVKIMMLTARSQQKDEQEAKRAGVDYFLSKPFSPAHLVTIVEEALHD